MKKSIRAYIDSLSEQQFRAARATAATAQRFTVGKAGVLRTRRLGVVAVAAGEVLDVETYGRDSIARGMAALELRPQFNDDTPEPAALDDAVKP